MKIGGSEKAVIFGAGSSIVKYKDAILRYLETDNFVTIGCKNIGGVIRPDYHCWFDSSAFERDAKMLAEKGISVIQKGSMPVFLRSCKKKIIKKYWGHRWITIDCNFTSWKAENPFPRYVKRRGKYWGAFINTGCLAIFWAYRQGFKEIDVVGMDGYSFYSKDDLLSGEESQHCSGSGATFFKRKQYFDEDIEEEIDLMYDKMKYKDDKINKTLTYLKTKYNINFRILTPTCYKSFYDGSVLKRD